MEQKKWSLSQFILTQQPSTSKCPTLQIAVSEKTIESVSDWWTKRSWDVVLQFSVDTERGRTVCGECSGAPSHGGDVSPLGPSDSDILIVTQSMSAGDTDHSPSIYTQLMRNSVQCQYCAGNDNDKWIKSFKFFICLKTFVYVDTNRKSEKSNKFAVLNNFQKGFLPIIFLLRVLLVAGLFTKAYFEYQNITLIKLFHCQRQTASGAAKRKKDSSKNVNFLFS